MKTRSIAIVIVGFGIASCNSKEQRTEYHEKISGVYVREHSFNVLNNESGQEVGVRTVRDSIFIKRFEDMFEISNHKWVNNDYDQEGWRNMEHSDDRPKPSYFAAYDSKDRELKTENQPALHIDLQNQIVFWRKESKYKKVVD
jgi:hypothetical protein